MLRHPEETGPALTGRRSALLVSALATASLLQWVGASSVLPLLPVYLIRRGASEAMVGTVVAAFFVGGFAAQYLAGRTGDRIGYRPVLVAGLLGYALASTGFLLVLDGWGYVVLRTVQGAAAGASQVASLALVSRAVPRTMRGRAFSVVYGAELAGIALGPLLGATFGLEGMSTLFFIASGGALVALIPVLALRMLGVAGDPVPERNYRLRLPWRGMPGKALIGVLVASVFGGLMTGVYEACWSLLMDYRGASTRQIGASWTLYAIPFVVVSPLAGWMADHLDRRVLVIGASISSTVFCLVYPLVEAPTWLIGLGSFEAMGVAVAMPAAQSLLADAVPGELAGQAQGLFASLQTAAIGGSALAAGALFGISPGLPFFAVAAAGVGLLAAMIVIWWAVPGRITPVTVGVPG